MLLAELGGKERGLIGAHTLPSCPLAPPCSSQVLCFDHNLKLMWEQDVRVKFSHHSHINEVREKSTVEQREGQEEGLLRVGEG